MNTNKIVTTSHSPSDDIIWQPVAMASIKSDPKSRYPGMKTISIKVFSSFCIILGLASIGVQVMWLNLLFESNLFVHQLNNYFITAYRLLRWR